MLTATAGVAIADFSRRAPALHEQVRRQTGLDVHAAADSTCRYLLDYRDGRLCLVDTVAAHRPFHVDLDRVRRAGAGRDLLRRATGRGTSSVIDATAGFGSDAAHLARGGLRVTAIERCAVIAVLLGDALSRCTDAAVRDRLRVVHGEASRLLGSLDAEVVYLDPLFDAPGRIKSRSRWSMTLARDLAGDDADAVSLLETARDNYERVVVKRPDKSPPLAGGVHHVHRGKTVRYDVYLATRPAR